MSYELTGWLDWLPNELQGSTPLGSLFLGLCTWILLLGSWASKLGFLCLANILQTERPPSPRALYFMESYSWQLFSHHLSLNYLNIFREQWYIYLINCFKMRILANEMIFFLKLFDSPETKSVWLFFLLFSFLS